MRISLKSGFLLLFIFSFDPIFAQVSKVVNDNLWISYTGVHSINNKTSMHAEISLRRNEYLKNPQQLLFRTALLRNLGKGWSVAGAIVLWKPILMVGCPASQLFRRTACGAAASAKTIQAF